MSFVPMNNIAKIDDYTDSPKFGTVIYNEDPEKLGRIKVSLTGIFEPTDEIGSNLPWVRQLTDTFLCGNGCETFSVPEVGSVVEIKWAYDNNTPFYTGAPYSKKHQTGTFLEDYPNTKGLKIGDFVLKINELKSTAQITHPGFTLTINNDGSAQLELGSTLKIKAPNTTFEGGLGTTKGANGVITHGVTATVTQGIVTAIN